MIDNCSDKLMKFLINKRILKERQYENWDFYFRIFLFIFIIMNLLFIITIPTNSWKEMILICIVFNIIRANCINNGFHADSLEKCIVISTVYISICSILAHMFIPYSIILYILACAGSLYLYAKYIPSKICYENKNKYVLLMLTLIGLMTIGAFLCLKSHIYQWVLSGISMGVLSVVCITCDKFEGFLRKIQKYIKIK